MAIYHFSVKTISRGQGRSAIACSAYRSGEKLVCEFYGKEQDYTKKIGVEFTEIYAPENTNTELLNRQKLWNEVEKVERRKDALLAREFEIAFPKELNKEQRKKMLDDLCQNLVKKHGVIVDAAIHAPHTDGGSDERNYHAHIMFTTRSINEYGHLSAKKYRDFSRDSGTETVSNWREHFAELTNSHLEKAGFDVRVDHRSYEKQENDLEATTHEGPTVTKLRRLGIETKISRKNDVIRQRNIDKPSKKLLEHEIPVADAILSDLQRSKTKADAELKQQREIAAERERERLHAQSILDAQKRALEFHAAFNPDVPNKKMLMQYLDDHALLAKNGQEPKRPPPVEQPKQNWWQKIIGQELPVVEQPQFFEIKYVRSTAKEIVEREKRRAEDAKEKRLRDFMRNYDSAVDEIEKSIFHRAYRSESKPEDLELKEFVDYYRKDKLEKEQTKLKTEADYRNFLRAEAEKKQAEAEEIRLEKIRLEAKYAANREREKKDEQENDERLRNFFSNNENRGNEQKKGPKNDFEL